MQEKDPNGVEQHESGAKLDSGKIMGSLLGLFPRALTEVLRVGTYGATKYTYGGFLDVEDGVRRYTDAMFRHYLKESMGQVFDDDPYYETPEGREWYQKIRHDAQVAWNALARLELRLLEEEEPDRILAEMKERVLRDGAVEEDDPSNATILFETGP